MKTILHTSTLLIIIACTFSCEKIVAEDITNKTPELILPQANDTVSANPVFFKWFATEGATKYHLMVASPSFSNISSYPIDTVVTSTSFIYFLDSNEYELKLVAQNGGYESQELGPIKFWVGTQSGSSGSNVVLQSPSNGLYVNNTFNNLFQWGAVNGATSYEYSIRMGNSFQTGTIIETQNNISTNNYTVSNTLTEGEYHWGVKAFLSGGSETPYSTSMLYVDTTDPNVPTLSSPADFSFLSQGSITFSWGNGTDPGTINAPVSSTIEIATDAGFSNIIYANSLSATTDIAALNSGTYYWRVMNSDDAGNASGYSTTFQLTIF